MWEGLTGQKFNVVYADPPWRYRDKAKAGNRGAECQYPVMTLDEIKALPVQELAQKDCALFMWATWPLLTEALEVIQAWDFTYKTIGFVWVKLNRSGQGVFTGLGHYTRSNSEPCLLATRGKVKRISASVHSVLHAPLRRHSEKPPETRDRIVQLLGDVPRVELFARQAVPGWARWGLEAP